MSKDRRQRRDGIIPGLDGLAARMRKLGAEPPRHLLLHNDRKPELTPEEARRDHFEMLRFMAGHAIAGVLIGIALGLALILFDIGGLGTRISRAANPALPVLLVLAPLASIFGAAATASAILTLPYGAKYRQRQEGDDRD